MRAAVLTKLKSPLDLQERPSLQPGPGEVVVDIKAAALNRRDYWITQGLYPGIDPPVVLGSDAAGVVSRCGDAEAETWLRREVIVNPGFNWGSNPAVQSAEFTILGLPTDGTFATEVCVPVNSLFPKPDHLDWQQAAALPLAGVTAYRALFTQGELKSGQKVLISGIGGGVATFGLQFAVAAGAEVWVTSSSDDKIARAVDAGARGGFLYTDDDWTRVMKEKAGAPSLIVDSAGGPGYRALLDLVAPGGRIVNYGATAGPPEKLDLFKVFWKQLKLVGSTMGSPDDFSAMLRFVGDNKLAPIIDERFSLDAVNDALSKMKSSPQFGKYVLEVA